MKNKILIAVIGTGAVAAAAAVGRKLYEMGLTTGSISGYFHALNDVAESLAADRKTVDADEYDALADKYDELVDEYNALREELENQEFYGG